MEGAFLSIIMIFLLSSTSDDNLLKNIELFDKLSLRFSGRVLFIKDVIGSSEICCWSFYGHGKKAAEVCCTSIVYATDKKHTKVRLIFHFLKQTFSSKLHIFSTSSSSLVDTKRGGGISGIMTKNKGVVRIFYFRGCVGGGVLPQKSV